MRFLLFTHLFIGLCAASLVIETIGVCGLPMRTNIAYLGMVFFATVFTYNIKGILMLAGKNVVIQTEKSSWIFNNEIAVKLIFLISCLGLMTTVLFLKVIDVYFLFPLGVLSLGYSISFSIKKYKIEFRRIPLFKTFLVASVWSLVVAYLPFIESLVHPSVERLIQIFLFLFPLTILFDIKDLEIDRNNNIKTFPLVLGVKGTKNLSILLLAARLAFVFFYMNSPETILSEFLITLLSIVIISRYLKEDSSEYFYMFFIDGLMLVKSLLTLLFCVELQKFS